MEGSEALKRDWTSLPPEVLNLIAKKLEEIPDFVRFRAVCPAWSSSIPITDVPAQFPWILVSHHNSDEQTLRFYSISANKQYTVHSPKLVNKKIFSWMEGYLPNLKNKQLCLFNPLNNHKIPLPSYDSDSSPRKFGRLMLRMNRKGKSVIVKKYEGPTYNSILSFCNVGQDNWCHLKFPTEYGNDMPYYLNDMLFFINDRTGATHVMDTTTGAIAYVIPSVDGLATTKRIDLVETLGDILRFSKHDDHSGKIWWDVHRLDASENGSRCWVKVTNIGNYAFFAANWKGGFMLEANELARIKANSVYSISACGKCEGQLRRIDIETGATEVLPFPVSPAGWFVPVLHHH